MEANVAVPAALIADPARAAILMALLDGRAQPATAVAYAVGISAQSASNHLGKLVAGGLLKLRSAGRHRYYCLANTEVAHVLEGLAGLAPPVKSLETPRSPQARQLRAARSCYDHLAGRLGVALADALVRQRWLSEITGDDERYVITQEGRERFAAFGVALDDLKPDRRGIARKCLDWTERRNHLAGPAGVRLLARLTALGWLERGNGPRGRGVMVTPVGVTGLREQFGLVVDEVSAVAPAALSAA
ncbi:MAG TPA: winged helix-turn-helix domain-containing protein [Stellaceae bacterium]|nr:winged helix-turn-helix domain-containing protein [Stellaceae bacterium]